MSAVPSPSLGVRRYGHGKDGSGHANERPPEDRPAYDGSDLKSIDTRAQTHIYYQERGTTKLYTRLVSTPRCLVSFDPAVRVDSARPSPPRPRWPESSRGALAAAPLGSGRKRSIRRTPRGQLWPPGGSQGKTALSHGKT